MRRVRVLTHEEVLKDLQRIDEIDLGDNEICDFDGDEEYVPTESNNYDYESEISSHHDIGRCAAQNVVKETICPTSYAKRNICEDSVLSARRLIFSSQMMHKKECTEVARRLLNKNTWTVSFDELEAVFSIMYARGLYRAKNSPLNTSWSIVWDPSFFSQTMARDSFKEIIHFLRFDHKTERSECLKSDKFALVSTLRYPFIENSASCYKLGVNLTVDEQLFPSKARCPFI
ncbi:hypothetical protein AVEN_203592-1 [Araneus ventricosus]|uniref:PiggyBac transposable element-derived protein domain-containing protein n=1 Tax=Araneus ventricosus TaxID=182803 RepID=A0A4Y2ELD6_ARAVE|nr:hypothetical protein AVEN_203592-1 [Araneus ventricosus]